MEYKIVEIEKRYDKEICNIIKSVGREFGAIGDGFGPSDDEVLNMSNHYKRNDRGVYYIVIGDGKVLGGGGIAIYNNRDDICELKKLFILPEGRGFGIGEKLATLLLEEGRGLGYKKCYLDTLSNMKGAIALYEKLGFNHLDKPLEGTIHGGCDIWMLKEL